MTNRKSLTPARVRLFCCPCYCYRRGFIRFTRTVGVLTLLRIYELTKTVWDGAQASTNPYAFIVANLFALREYQTFKQLSVNSLEQASANPYVNYLIVPIFC
ncbi:conserved hypothetical protein [Brochothrix thermosphacta]|nr:conserved hypothetical protein [Brochothrix thermosphacta]